MARLGCILTILGTFAHDALEFLILVSALNRGSCTHHLKLLAVLRRDLNYTTRVVLGADTLFVLAVLGDSSLRNGHSAVAHLRPIEVDVVLRTSPDGCEGATSVLVRACEQRNVDLLSGGEFGRMASTTDTRSLVSRFI